MSGAGFVNLHNHSHYSILDGYSRPIEYLKRAAALGQPALALTDHGNLFGAFEFVSTARAMSKGLDKKKHPQEPVWVKPIVGIEAYMAPENPEGAKCKRSVYYSDDPSKRSIDVSSNGAYTHLTLLAVDDAGFHNLIRLSTESFKRENMYHKQRMDMSMLAKWNEGLVATTGCPSGEIQTRLRLGQTKEAYEYAERMADLFPGRYYVEIMSHAMKKDLEREAIPKLLKLAEDLKLPLLATNDAHYASPGDARRHEEMLCINTNSRGGAGERVYMDTPTEDTVDEWMEAHQKEAQDYLSRGRRVPTRFAFSGDDYYLKSFDEMIRQFPEDQFPGAVRNSLEIADMVGDWWAKDPLDLEALKTKYGNDVKLAEAGLEFTDDYRLPHAGGGVTREAVKANKGVTVLGSTPEHAVEFKSDPLTQKLIDDGTVALGPYDLSLNKGIRPVIQIPEGWTEDQWFRKKLNDGFVQRRVAKGDSPEILAESKRRLDVEYPVFEGNDFVQYMLVVADYIAWAREHGVTVGSGRGCFLPGTRVKGKQGAMRRIEDYVPGDVVQTHDTSYHKVEKVFEYDVEDEDCVEVRLTSGATIRCTADHMLFAKDQGFTQAQELESGSVLLGPVGRKEPFTIECMNEGCHNKITLRKQDYDVRLNKEYTSKKGEVWCWDCVKHHVHNVPAVQAGSIKGALRNKDADVKAKNAASIHAHWNDPVARAAHLAKIEDWKNSEKFQEFRRHCSERNKRRYSDDAELDKLLRQGHGNYKSGWFTSYQQDRLRIYYASSYELKALNILETDSTVASFDRFDGRIGYVAPSDGREHWYLPDFRVDYADGRKVVIEVKAKWQEKEPDTQAKLQAGEKWCQDNGFDFEVWDEDVLASKNDAWHHEYTVESVVHFRYTGKVYDLQVEGVHNYNVQGVTAHNSVGGSEVAYLMDISRTDPIRHDLLFERFLNPERKSPPDVDTDFKASVRNDVLQYAKDKYGYGNVANIVNFGTFKLKQAFQDIAKIYHADSSQAIKMSKMIPDPIDHVEPTMEDLYDPKSPFYPLAEDFRAAIEAGGEQWKPIREAAGALVGRVRQTGTHACGVIMCSEPIVDYAPLFWNSNEARAKENIWTDCMCQWKYQDLEAIGLIKMDFLPLSTLDVVDSVISNVEQYNEAIDSAAGAASKAGDAGRAAEYRKRKLEVPNFTDIENDGMSDPETYAMLARGESDAVFQMGSDGQKDLLKRIRPTEFNDLVAINALYRPGPMAMNAHLQYADRKNGKEPCYVINEELDKVFKGTPMEDILRPTYGLCVPGDEKVLDATTGLHVPIRDFEVGHKTKSWNEETGEWSANVVSDLVHTGMKDCVEITVSNHRKVRVSKTHPLLTPRGWVAAGDLTVGDELAMNDVAMPEIEDKSGLTPDLAWFIGVMLGDGTIPGSKGYPYVTTTDQVIIDELARIAEENFGNIEVTGTKPEDAGGVNGNVHHVMFVNADRRPVGKHDRHAVGYCGDRNTVNQFLARYGYKGKIRMYDKAVTPEVMRGSNEIIRNVVAGMWDTDGTCSKTGLHYTTTSRGLYEGMCQMLDRLGVRVRVSEAPYHNEKRADRVAYRVYPNAEAFRREIVDRLRLKKTAFLSNCVMDHEPAKSMERRPSRFQQEVIEAARELVRNDPSMLSGVDVTDPRIAKNLSLRTLWSAFTGRSFKEYPAKTIAFKQLANSIKNLLPRSLQAKMDTPWRQITAIRSIGEMDCYDITVENDHTFLLDGVISHNCVYQEQIMQISQAMAGYTKGEADSLRKAMGHKIAEEMEANRVRFEDGALKLAKERGYKYSKADLEKFWAFIADFAKYCFNRSHSVSYAINAYETAYLKCHYKPFFWAANLTQNMKNKDKFRKFLRSAKDMGLQVASVDVNKSGVGVTAAFDPDSPVTDTITFGFDTASGVNEAVAGEIVRARSANGGSFKSFDDFMTHGPESILSAGAIVGLADAGAFDCLGVKRKQVADRAKWIVDFYKRKRAAVSSSSMGLLGMLGGGSAASTEKSMGEYDLTKSEWSKKEGTISFGPLSYDWGTMLAKEKESLGVYASADPLSNAGYGLEVMKRNPSSPYRAISELEAEARQAQAGPSAADSDGWHRKAATVRVIGYLVDLVVKRNAKGGVWFSGSICDESGSIEFRMYSKAIQQRMSETGLSDPKTVISEDTVYDLTCSWSADTGRLMISDVSEVPMAKADGAVPIIIRMKSEGSLRSAKWRAVASLMDAHPGNVPVAVDLAKSTGSVELDGRPAHRGVNMLGARVDASSEFMDELTRLVGDRLCSWESKAKWDPAY